MSIYDDGPNGLVAPIRAPSQEADGTSYFSTLQVHTPTIRDLAQATPFAAGVESIASTLQTGAGKVTVAVAADSTANDHVDWVRLWAEAERRRRPSSLRIEYLNWDSVTNAYLARVVQEGTDLSPSPAVMVDDFNRTGEIVGSVSSGGQIWNGSPGGWAGDGQVARNYSPVRRLVYDTLTVDGSTEFTLQITTGPAPAANQTMRIHGGSPSPLLNGGVWAAVNLTKSGTVTVEVYKTIGGTTTTILGAVSAGLTALSTTPQTLKVKLTQTSQNVSLELTPNGGAPATHTPTALTEGDYATLGSWRGILNASGVTPAMAIDAANFSIPASPPSFNTLRILNAAVSGSTFDYQASRIATMYPSDEYIDTLILSSGHNYAMTSPTAYLENMTAFVNAYAAAHPETKFIYASQNPQYFPSRYITAHAARQVAGRRHARLNGWGYLPVFERFQTLDNRALVQADGVHPTHPLTITPNTTTGQGLWADTMREFVSAYEV